MRYRDLTVEELQAQIVEYRTAKKETATGGVGTVIAEGRRIDYVRPNQDGLNEELRELEAELARRPGFEDRGQWALGVELYR
jgi:ribosomal protein L29